MTISVLTRPLLDQVERTLIRVGPLSGNDRLAVMAMLGRCSPATRYRRFHGVTDGHSHVARVLADVPGQAAYGAWSAGTCVGLASLAADDDGATHIGVVVSDEWQARGVGSALVAALVARARQLGLSSLTADVAADDRFIVAALGRIGPIRTIFDGGGCTVLLGL